MTERPIEAALFSSAKKCDEDGTNGIELLARPLAKRGWPILASGGTAKYLHEKGVPVKDVADIVGAPILDHRVVTLSREIHAGLLALEKDQAELDKLGVPRIGLVYVDLYDLAEALNDPNRTFAKLIEKVDIGGPTMLRSAAKGQRIVVSSRDQFSFVIDFIDHVRGSPNHVRGLPGRIQLPGDESTEERDRRSLCRLAALGEAVARKHGALAELFYQMVADGKIR